MDFANYLRRFIISTKEITTSMVEKYLRRREPPSSAVDMEIPAVEQHQQGEAVQAGGGNSEVANYNYKQQQTIMLELPLVIVGFCFTTAIEIALYSLQPDARLPATLHLVSFAILLSFASLLVSKYIHSNLPFPSKVMEHLGVLFATIAFFLAITLSFPLCLKLTSWSIFALSLLAILICNLINKHPNP